MMNGIARVKNVIRRQPGTSIVRGELTIDAEFTKDFLNWRTDGAAAEKLTPRKRLMECCRALKLDLVCLQAPDLVQNTWDDSMQTSAIRWFGEEGLFVFWLVNGAFQMATQNVNMMTLLADIARSPDAVGLELRRNSEQVISTIQKGVAAGAHGIMLADDIAYHQTTYMDPDFIERYLLPLWKTQVETARKLGVPIFFHSDGNLKAVLSHILSAGFDGLQCIEPAAGMDIGKLKIRYGEDLCLMGNLDPSLLVETGKQGASKSDFNLLRRTVGDLIGSAAGEGGFIFGTCSGLHAGMSPQRVDYMYRLAAELDPASRG
jgi:uroporphyrinogen decarboxylase